MVMAEALALDVTEPEDAARDVPAGYRTTPIGIIPEDWELKPVGELLEFKNGLNKAKQFFGYGTPIINYMDVWEHTGVKRQDIAGLVDVTRKEIEAYSAKKGDVLFTRTSETLEEIGYASVVMDHIEDAVFSGFVLRGRSKSDELIDGFKRYCFRSEPARHQIISKGTYTTRALTNGRSLSTVLLPYPNNKFEQEAIAEALSDQDDLISNLEKLILKKRWIKKGALQDLMSGGRRLQGFEEEWQPHRLSELGTFLKGSGVRKDEANSGSLPCIRYGEIYTVHNDIIREFVSGISPEVAGTATRIQKGDILFAGSGETKAEIGKCVALIEDVDAFAGGDIVILRTKGQDAGFLGYALNSFEPQRQKASKGQGDAVVHISASALSSILVRIPKTHEQAAIARVAIEIDEELTTLIHKLEKALRVKAGMMQTLLTGKARLV